MTQDTKIAIARGFFWSSIVFLSFRVGYWFGADLRFEKTYIFGRKHTFQEALLEIDRVKKLRDKQTQELIDKIFQATKPSWYKEKNGCFSLPTKSKDVAIDLLFFGPNDKDFKQALSHYSDDAEIIYCPL